MKERFVIHCATTVEMYHNEHRMQLDIQNVANTRRISLLFQEISASLETTE